MRAFGVASNAGRRRYRIVIVIGGVGESLSELERARVAAETGVGKRLYTSGRVFLWTKK